MHHNTLSPSQVLLIGLITTTIGIVMIAAHRAIGDFVETNGRGNRLTVLIVGLGFVTVGGTFVLSGLILK